MTFADGSAGDADYAAIGPGYTRYRQPEPLIFDRIDKALGDATTEVVAKLSSGDDRGMQMLSLTPSEVRIVCSVAALNQVR